ncbi:MAG: ribbon-helix-helix protein, CopG family [Deltaproteobacteria bacterium]|nr:ribbon-helix-helix protein, CopG family [Deltaproteobacteria bacterium]
MRETFTVSLPFALRKKLDRTVKEDRLNRSDVVREALSHYFTLREFRRLRGLMVPLAEKRGIFTDEDVFKLVS